LVFLFNDFQSSVEVRMFRFPMLMVMMLVVLAGPSGAAAQTAPGVPPPAGRLTISANAGIQPSSQDITRSSVFTLYEEEARIDVAQNDIEGGGLFDFGANYRIRNQFGAGFAYSFVGSDGDGVVTGSIPHPLFFDQFRTLSASSSGLDHKERGFHLHATWHIPFTEDLDFTVSAGPSFFNISQDFVRRVTFSETPPFDQVTVDEVELLSLKQNAVGFNIGIDAHYTVTPMLGVGVLARFSRAEAEFDINDNDAATVKAGGFQLAAGVRVRLF
jgi:hypothetical protein